MRRSPRQNTTSIESWLTTQSPVFCSWSGWAACELAASQIGNADVRLRPEDNFADEAFYTEHTTSHDELQLTHFFIPIWSTSPPTVGHRRTGAFPHHHFVILPRCTRLSLSFTTLQTTTHSTMSSSGSKRLTDTLAKVSTSCSSVTSRI